MEVPKIHRSLSFSLLCGAPREILDTQTAIFHHFRMSKPLCSLISLVVGLAAIGPLRAETVSFPKDEPAFKIDVPDGWAAKGKKYFLMVAFGKSANATANKDFLKKS